MPYPNYPGKDKEPALFNAKEFITWRNYLKRDYRDAPKKYIIIYYPNILRHFRKNRETKKIRLYRLVSIHQYLDVGVVMMTGIGSPNAAVAMEELIALGGEYFINIGSAGGLESFGTYLCEKSLRDEGTSHHYLPDAEFAYPDKELTLRLQQSMQHQDITFQIAPSWTIDAPYRETKAEIQRYRRKGIKTVEMESAAIFAVARARKVQAAAAFVVTDLVSKDTWQPKFRARSVNKALYALFDAALTSLL